jgi:hypothetical protein
MKASDYGDQILWVGKVNTVWNTVLYLLPSVTFSEHSLLLKFD